MRVDKLFPINQHSRNRMSESERFEGARIWKRLVNVSKKGTIVLLEIHLPEEMKDEIPMHFDIDPFSFVFPLRHNSLIHRMLF